MWSLVFDNHPRLHLTVVQHAVSPQFLVAYAEAYLVSHKSCGVAFVTRQEMDEMLAHPFFWCKGYVASSQYVVYPWVFLGARQLYFESR